MNDENKATINKYGKIVWTAEDVQTLRPDLTIVETD